MKVLVLGLFALGSYSAFATPTAAEIACAQEVPEVSFSCTYQAKTYPQRIFGNGKHPSKAIAKQIAKEDCESKSGAKCLYDYCSESFGLYSKSYQPGGSQTTTLGGSSPSAKAYREQRRKDRKELHSLRREVLKRCTSVE